MKRIVSISLGSSRRDHRFDTEVDGEAVRVERIGTNGNIRQAIALIRELDGTIDAFGLGGIDLRVVAGDRSYVFRDARRIARHAVRTPLVDGSGLKHTLERRVVQRLNTTTIPLANKKVLLVSAVDRFGMAEAFSDMGVEMVLGDLMFGLGINLPIRTMSGVRRIARVLLPVVTQLPFSWLYPTGKKQDEHVVRFAEYYRWADIIAGDFHYIRRHMPPSMPGKIILTNTVTAGDVDDLRARQVSLLVTTTPNLGGRSFGTNVMEAMIVALSGERPEHLTTRQYDEWLDRLGWSPRIEPLQ